MVLLRSSDVGYRCRSARFGASFYVAECNFSFNTFTNPKRVLGGDIDAHSFLLYTIPVKNFTPINMLKFILNN